MWAFRRLCLWRARNVFRVPSIHSDERREGSSVHRLACLAFFLGARREHCSGLVLLKGLVLALLTASSASFASTRTDSPRFVPQLEITSFTPRSVALAGTAGLLVVANNDGRVDVLDVSDPSRPQKLSEFFAGATSIAVSSGAGESRIATGADNGTVRLWALDGKPLGPPFVHDAGAVRSVALSPDGKRIAVGGTNGAVRLWTLNGESVGPPFVGHDGDVRSLQFSVDGTRVVSGGDDGTVRLWTLDGEQEHDPLGVHQGSVWSVAFSPDGMRIVSGGEDGTVRLWSRDGESPGSPFSGHDGAVRSVAFSPDGKWIISGGADDKVRLWTLDGSSIGSPLQGHGRGKAVRSVAFSPDGRWFVSASADNSVQLWTPTAESVGIPFDGHDGWVSSAAFSPDGERIASGSHDGTVRLWTLDGRPIGPPLKGHMAEVSSVAFSSDGARIYAGGRDGSVRRWRIGGEPIGTPIVDHGDAIRSIALSPYGTTIATGGEDGAVRLWTMDGEPVGTPFDGHKDWVLSVAFSPDGERIVSGGADDSVRLWTLDGEPVGKPFEGHEDWVRSVAFSPDGERIVSGSEDGTVRLWSLDGESPRSPFPGHDDAVRSVAFSADGKWIVSGSRDSTLRLWTPHGESIRPPLRGYDGHVETVAFSPDGRWIVSGGRDNNLRLWRLDFERLGVPILGRGRLFKSISLSSDRKRIITGGNDGKIRLWAFENQQSVTTAIEKLDSVESVATSPDGPRIVSGERNGSVRLWTLDGQLVRSPFEGHTDSVSSVAISRNGKHIVSGGSDRTVRLWAVDGEPVSTPFKGHEGRVLSVELSPDGERIVSGGGDNTVRLWTLGGKPGGKVLVGHEDWVTSVAFSSDGERIVSGSEDRTVRLWTHKGDNWIERTLGRHDNRVSSVAFSPRGNRVVSGGRDGTVRLWTSSDGEQHRIASCNVTDVQFSAELGERVFVGCSDRWLVVDARAGEVVGTLFPTREGIVAIVPTLGVWFPTENSRRFVREVNENLDVRRSQLIDIESDDLHLLRQTLLDEWTFRERIGKFLAELADSARSSYAELHLSLQASVWPVLAWISAGLIAVGFWVFAPWRLASWALPTVGAPEPPPWKWLIGMLAWYGWLGRTRRPVESWLDHYRPELERTCFIERDPVETRDRYGQPLDALMAPAWFDKESNCLLWIVGPGGGGKSALAFHLAREAFVGRSRRPMPILVDEDWNGALSEHIARLLRPPGSDREPTPRMVERLGSLGRLCPIVDSLSERTASDAVSRVGQAIAAHHFRYAIVTSREKPLTGQIWEAVHVVEARPIRPQDVPAFVASYVDDASGRETLTARMKYLYADASGTGSPSALFLRFALEQMMEGQEAPSRRIELVLRYLEVARRGVGIAAEDFQRAACFSAIEALRNERLAPAELAHERLVGALNAAADIAPFRDETRVGVVTPPKTIEFLESCGILQRNRLNHRLQFTYDPVAEYLTAWKIEQSPEGYASDVMRRVDARPNSGLARALREVRTQANVRRSRSRERARETDDPPVTH